MMRFFQFDAMLLCFVRNARADLLYKCRCCGVRLRFHWRLTRWRNHWIIQIFTRRSQWTDLCLVSHPPPLLLWDDSPDGCPNLVLFYKQTPIQLFMLAHRSGKRKQNALFIWFGFNRNVAFLMDRRERCRNSGTCVAIVRIHADSLRVRQWPIDKANE